MQSLLERPGFLKEFGWFTKVVLVSDAAWQELGRNVAFLAEPKYQLSFVNGKHVKKLGDGKLQVRFFGPATFVCLEPAEGVTEFINAHVVEVLHKPTVTRVGGDGVTDKLPIDVLGPTIPRAEFEKLVELDRLSKLLAKPAIAQQSVSQAHMHSQARTSASSAAARELVVERPERSDKKHAEASADELELESSNAAYRLLVSDDRDSQQ